MNFDMSEKQKEWLNRVQAFMKTHVRPAVPIYDKQDAEGPRWKVIPILEDLKKKARAEGLWNMFMPPNAHEDDEFRGAGLTNLEYALCAEEMGRILWSAEVFNCSAPDTGNMELLHMFGTPEQQRQWLGPLLEGDIRSCFAMTEPDVASSDATNIATRIERDGGDLVITGRKWWITGAADPRCRVALVLGVSDPDAGVHQRHSLVLVPFDTPGVVLVRDLTVFGYHDHQGHCEVRFEGVRVPAANLLGPAGAGFAVAQSRLGPGRVHHCMRAIGMSERALELMARRALSRTAFGATLAANGAVRRDIAESRITIEQLRLLVHKTAWLLDTVGHKGARIEVAAIKAAVPRAVAEIIDRAIQVHGGLGLSGDVPLAQLYAASRALRIADGPDDVHLESVARRELGRHQQA